MALDNQFTPGLVRLEVQDDAGEYRDVGTAVSFDVDSSGPVLVHETMDYLGQKLRTAEAKVCLRGTNLDQLVRVAEDIRTGSERGFRLVNDGGKRQEYYSFPGVPVEHAVSFDPYGEEHTLVIQMTGAAVTGHGE